MTSHAHNHVIYDINLQQLSAADQVTRNASFDNRSNSPDCPGVSASNSCSKSCFVRPFARLLRVRTSKVYSGSGVFCGSRLQ
jgi:hypothetical protein